MKRELWTLILLSLAVAPSACMTSGGAGDDDDSSSDADGGTDADSDVDTDADTDTGTSSGTDTGSGSDTGTGTGGDCGEPSMSSSCGNIASIIMGVATTSSDTTSGDLVVHMMHAAPSVTGIPHSGAVVEDVDLSTGSATFEFDMCAGGEMWSEQSCGYALVVFLDTNGTGDWAYRDTAPDPGEPSTVQTFDISCTNSGPMCFTLDLDCLTGASCVGYSSPACTCDDTCQSIDIGQYCS